MKPKVEIGSLKNNKNNKSSLLIFTLAQLLTFLLFTSSCQQSVEDVVVSLSGVLSYHAVLQKNQGSKVSMNILL